MKVEKSFLIDFYLPALFTVVRNENLLQNECRWTSYQYFKSDWMPATVQQSTKKESEMKYLTISHARFFNVVTRSEQHKTINL